MKGRRGGTKRPTELGDILVNSLPGKRVLGVLTLRTVVGRDPPTRLSVEMNIRTLLEGDGVGLGIRVITDWAIGWPPRVSVNFPMDTHVVSDPLHNEAHRACEGKTHLESGDTGEAGAAREQLITEAC